MRYEIDWCKVCHRVFCSEKDTWLDREECKHISDETNNIIIIVRAGAWKRMTPEFLEHMKING
jgi:hypothetical protein